MARSLGPAPPAVIQRTPRAGRRSFPMAATAGSYAYFSRVRLSLRGPNRCTGVAGFSQNMAMNHDAWRRA